MEAAIDRPLPHPKMVANTRPSTPPIAQPVRQCSVAEMAVRLRFWSPPGAGWPWCSACWAC
jgi:hypothetical protein